MLIFLFCLKFFVLLFGFKIKDKYCKLIFILFFALNNVEFLINISMKFLFFLIIILSLFADITVSQDKYTYK